MHPRKDSPPPAGFVFPLINARRSRRPAAQHARDEEFFWKVLESGGALLMNNNERRTAREHSQFSELISAILLLD